MIIVIGRGHSGTRAIARTLVESGVYMGELSKNGTYDHVPAEAAYEACKLVTERVPWPWDFSKLGEPTNTFKTLMHEYLRPVLQHAGPKGWKLPENTLMYPWLVQMFPDAHFIHWVRNPIDNIAQGHLTDSLERFGIAGPTDPPHTDLIDRRYHSWLYQEAIVASTPRPAHYRRVWLEDFVLHQEKTLRGLETFLRRPMVRIPVDRSTIARFTQDEPR
jgi:hypothetical protein